MGYRKFRADVKQTLIPFNPEQLPSSQDNFSTSGAYVPDMMPFDGKNIMPSLLGYFSFFGQDVDFEDPLLKDIQDVVTYRTDLGDTILIALCKDGIYIKSILGMATPGVSYTAVGAIPDDPDIRLRHLEGYTDITFVDGNCEWTRVGFSAFGSPNPWALWTWAIVNNKIYFYQQGLGHILNLYGHEKGIIRVDQLEPSFIIGSVPIFNWTFTGQDSTLCTDTKKSFTIPGLGTFSVYQLDKAHYIKNVTKLWADTALSFLGTGVSIAEQSKTITPLEGVVKIAPLSDEPDEPQEYPTLGQLDDQAPIVIGAGQVNQAWDFVVNNPYSHSDGGSTYGVSSNDITIAAIAASPVDGHYHTPYALAALLAPIDGMVVEFDYTFTAGALQVITARTETQNLEVDCKVGYSAAPGGTLFDGQFFSLVDTPFTPDAKVFTGHFSRFLTSAQGIAYLQIEVGAMSANGDSTYFSHVKRDSTLVISNLKVWRPYYSTGYSDFLPFRIYTPPYSTANSVAMHNNWSYGLTKGSATYNPAVSFEFGNQASPSNDNLIQPTSIKIRPPTSGVIGDPGDWGTARVAIRCPVGSTTFYATLIAWLDSNGGPYAAKAGYVRLSYLPDENTVVDDTTFGSVTLYEADPDYSQQEHIKGVELNLLVPTGYYIVFWTKFYAREVINDLDSMHVAIHNPRFDAEDIPHQDYPVYNSIVLVSDGEESELSSSWNVTQQELTVTGFKEFGLTAVHIYSDGDFVRRFTLPLLADMNDLWTTLVIELGAAFPLATVTPILNQAAEATVDYTIQVSYVDFDETTPVPTVSHDGSCAWSLTSTDVGALKLAQVNGITSARGRLVAWDRENALYTSSNQDPLDFTPDIATQANVGKAQAVQGNIILCKGWADGFTIYATGNVINAKYTGGTYTFDYTPLSDHGVIDPRHISGNMWEHFFWSNKGLVEVTPGDNIAKDMVPEIADWLNQHRFPIKTSFIGDRFLVLSLLSVSPGVYSPIERREAGSGTAHEKGEDQYIERLAANPALLTFPFGSNLFEDYPISLIYDSVLQKWGIAIFSHKTLFSLNPINAKGFPSEKSPEQREVLYSNKIRSLGGVLADGTTLLFNDNPDDAYICYGHVKFANDIWSRINRVDAEFVDYAKSVIQVEPSHDDRNPKWDRVVQSNESLGNINIFNTDIAGEWFNIVVRGTFHLRSLTVRGFPHGAL